MDQQTRQKLAKLYNLAGPRSRAAMRQTFPEIFDSAVRVVAFRVPLDPGKLSNQDGVHLMEVTYEGNAIRLNESLRWTLKTNANGTQILSAERKDHGDGC